MAVWVRGYDWSKNVTLLLALSRRENFDTSENDIPVYW